MATKYLRKAHLAQRYGVNVRTVERMVEDGRLPAPIYLGRLPMWNEAQLDAADRAAMVKRPTDKSASTVA